MTVERKLTWAGILEYVVKKGFSYLVAPSAPPKNFKAWNLSSTSLHVQWDPIPIGERNGNVLGYSVQIKLDQQKDEGGKAISTFTASRNLTLSGLKKYSKYVIGVCGLTQRGKGPSRALTVQTDEDGKSNNL